MHSKITMCCDGASKWKLSKDYDQVEMVFDDPFLPPGMIKK